MKLTSSVRLLACLGAGSWASFSAAAERPVDFNRDIRPLLSDNCFFCHGPDASERKAGLRLDTFEGATADLGGYSAIAPGNPELSELVRRITDAEDPMPPADSHKELSPGERELLARWIAEGAAWSDPWAYVPPRKHPVPEPREAAWPANWVDRFVLARLESEGLAPSPEADRVTLIRRLHFDLIGLPPSPAAVAAFVAAPGEFEAAWGDLVDSLLDSPHFGERLAIYWLDLARYADTVGYHGDQDHHISPYRDYVIQSFNANLPFDQFTREQLAGDLLPGAGPRQKIASGYNRLLQTSHEGGVQLQEYDAIYAADRVRNLSAVWMGATVGCAQCHDHKYDPYTLRDHYALAAFFADIHDRGFGGNNLPALRPPEMMVYTPEQEAELARLEHAIAAALPAAVRERIEGLETERSQVAEQARKAKSEEETAALEAKAAGIEQAIAATAPAPARAAWTQLRDERAALEAQGRATMITVAQPPRPTRVLARGDWQDETGQVAEPAVPAFLGRIELPEGERATRLHLADWLMDPEQGAGGLTARVFANRFWYLFFGTGISRSLEDFGGQGEPPAHPELLDQLALAFQESGWDVKGLVRLLVTSRAYRQSSLDTPERVERDPHRQLASRQARYRLPAELVRDNALAVSGLLAARTDPGPSVKPYQPAGYYRHLNFPVREYQPHLDSRQWQRGVYVHWQRMFLHPTLKAMDAPSREECVAERPVSNTPAAALALLNDPSFVEAARVFAARVLAEAPDDFDARLDHAFRLAVSRSPDEAEIRLLASLHRQASDEFQSSPQAAAALLGVGIAPSPGGADPVELASWTAVTRALLNLSETMTRN